MRKLWIALALLVCLLLSYRVWKPYARKYKWFLVATNIGQDSLRRFGLLKTQIGDNQGGARRDLTEAERAEATFRNYQAYAGVNREAITGKDVFEVGPGDNLGVAIMFASHGARKVVAQDRFLPFRDSPFHRQLYQRIREHLGEPERRDMDTAITVDDNGIKLNEQRLKHIYGTGVEEAADSLFGPASFDWIVSNAVLEEVYEIDRAMEAMNKLLRPGGHMVHKIDLSDYGMFTNQGFHPLEFLTIPDTIYRYMSQNVGQPNRRLINYYRDKLRSFGYTDFTINITLVTGGQGPEFPAGTTQLVEGKHYSPEHKAWITSIRPRLLERYRSLPDEDLLTGGIVVVAHKPQ